MASSFAVVMLVASNLLTALDDPAMVGMPGLEKFVAGLAELGLDQEQQDAWRYLIGISGFEP